MTKLKRRPSAARRPRAGCRLKSLDGCHDLKSLIKWLTVNPSPCSFLTPSRRRRVVIDLTPAWKRAMERIKVEVRGWAEWGWGCLSGPTSLSGSAFQRSDRRVLIYGDGTLAAVFFQVSEPQWVPLGNTRRAVIGHFISSCGHPH